MSTQATPAIAVAEPVTAAELSPVDSAAPATPAAAEPLVESELLVEDVSIDGMCGVY